MTSELERFSDLVMDRLLTQYLFSGNHGRNQVAAGSQLCDDDGCDMQQDQACQDIKTIDMHRNNDFSVFTHARIGRAVVKMRCVRDQQSRVNARCCDPLSNPVTKGRIEQVCAGKHQPRDGLSGQ